MSEPKCAKSGCEANSADFEGAWFCTRCLVRFAELEDQLDCEKSELIDRAEKAEGEVKRLEHLLKLSAAEVALMVRLRNQAHEALEWVLRFHSGKPWGPEDERLWRRWTGREECTTKALCDQIREVLQ